MNWLRLQVKPVWLLTLRSFQSKMEVSQLLGDQDPCVGDGGLNFANSRKTTTSIVTI